MGHALDELVGEEVHLVRDERDELEALDEALHLVLAADVDVQRAAEELVEAVCTAARRHDLHATPHLVERHAVHLRGALDECLDERDACVDVVRLEALEVERATGKVLHGGGGGRAPHERVVQQPVRERGGAALEYKWCQGAALLASGVPRGGEEAARAVVGWRV